MRQLFMMRDGKQDAELDLLHVRQNDDWDQTAHLLSKINNLTASKESELKTPDQCNPTLNGGQDDDPAERAEQDLIIAARIEAEKARIAATTGEASHGEQIID